MTSPKDVADREREEANAVRRRYAARDAANDARRYSLMNGAALQAHHERQAAIVRLLKRHGWASLQGLRMLDVGCGAGGHLSDFIRLGADPALLTGLELLPARAAEARAQLPASVSVMEGDALHAKVAPLSQDLVMQVTVFSSLLDNAVQRRLADTMWQWLKPGGAVLWYDFVVNNPGNPDVRGVPMVRVRNLFPKGQIQSQRVTLAPPLARRLPDGVRPWLNWPLLRTHVVALIGKPLG